MILLVAALLAGATPAPARAKGTPPAPAPANAPAFTVKKVEQSATDVKAQTYVVASGDTLSRVVLKTGAGADAIVRTNGLAPPYTLKPKQKLQIPAGRYHRVGKGENGIAIARAYGVDWNRIANLNHIEQGDLLREGDRLLVPSEREVSVMSLDERARAFRIDLDDLVTGTEPALGKRAKPAPPVQTAARAVPDDQPIAAPKQAFSGNFRWPLKGKVILPYGPLANGGRNDGINIHARGGETVTAAADGVVRFAGRYPAFGQVVLVQHGSGWVTIYGYAQKLLVVRGQAVKRGQPLVQAGASGAANEPQLHFEIRDKQGHPVNPIDRLPVGD